MQLHEYESKIFPHISQTKTVAELEDKSGLSQIQVMRGLQWLSNKQLLDLNYQAIQLIDLDINGKLYKKKGLPEIRFLKALETGDPLSLEQIQKKASLSSQEAGVSIGTLKKKVAIHSTQLDGILVFHITPQGKKLLEKTSLEQEFLTLCFPLKADQLTPEQTFALDHLKSRKQILKIEQKNIPTFTLTTKGKKLAKEGIDTTAYASRLTPKMLKDGSWKQAEFRSFDVHAKVPPITGAKTHYVNQAIEYIKQVWLDMGFTQMQGNIIQTAFWDLDALFVPQDHPARAMQDTFYIQSPETEQLPNAIAKKVKAVHEHGGKTGSDGWQAPWSEKEASQLMLRTHCTVLSAQTLAQLKEQDLPAKLFAVGRVFRNESMDATHLFEFHQVEGIVVDQNVSFQDLLGYLKAFFKKLGYPDVRIRPAYFPYTEPSAEVDVWHPVYKKWVELGGAGVFRPEVVEPLLGKKIPVLAWGLGLERGIVEYLGLKDLRDMYKNDIKQTNKQKYWMK